MLLCYITDRKQFSGGETQRREQLLERIAQAARCGVDFIQLREKDLGGRELEELARAAVARIRSSESKSRLLINSRTDVALAAGADGVHLRSKDVSTVDVRGIWREAGGATQAMVAVSCHCESEVVAARNAGADFVVFGPVFEKKDSPGAATAGVKALGPACGHEIPVFALGGVTVANAASCIRAGAKGIAGIRLFQEGDLEKTVAKLRG